MEDELVEILQKARESGANKDQLQTIVDTYQVKKKENLDPTVSVPDLPDSLGGQRVAQEVTLTPPDSPSPSVNGDSDSLEGLRYDSKESSSNVAYEATTPIVEKIKQGEDKEDDRSMIEKNLDFVKNFYKLRFEQGKDIVKHFMATGVEVAASFSGAKNFVNKTAFVAGLELNKAMGSPGIEAFEAKYNSATPEEQEKFIQSLTDYGAMGAKVPILGAKIPQLDQVGANIQNYLTDVSEGIRESTIQYEKNITDDIRNLDFETAAIRVANGISGSAPYLVLAALPGGLGMIGVSSAVSNQEQLERDGKKIDRNSIMNSWVNGTAEMAFELPTAALLRPFRKILMGDKTLAKKWTKHFIPRVLGAFGIEWESEGLTTTTQKMSNQFFIGEDPDIISKDFWGQLKESYLSEEAWDARIVGGATGGLIPVVTRVGANRVMNADKKKKFDEFDDAMQNIDAQINRDLSQEIVDDLKEVKVNIQAKQDELIEGEYQKFKNLPKEERKKLGDLEKELDGLKKQYEEIENSQLDSETKKLLKSKKADEAQRIYDEKTKIVEPTDETTPSEDIVPDGETGSGTNIVADQAKEEGVQPTTKPEPAKEPVETERKEVKVGRGTFTAVFNDQGGVKVLKKDGTEIPEYTDRKLKKGGTKKVKNPAYSSVYAKATGTLTDNQIAKERDAKWESVKTNYAPTTAGEVVDIALANGQKVSRESIRKELGEKASELTWATGLTKESDLPSIERLGEVLAEENTDLGFQSQDYRDAIIESLGAYSDVNTIRDEYIDRMESANDPYAGLSETEQLDAYLGRMTDQERSLYDAVKADESLNELSDDELISYYEKEYEKQIGSLPESEQAEIYEQIRLDNQALADESKGPAQDIAEKSEVKKEKRPKNTLKNIKQNVVLNGDFAVDGDFYWDASKIDPNRNYRVETNTLIEDVPVNRKNIKGEQYIGNGNVSDAIALLDKVKELKPAKKPATFMLDQLISMGRTASQLKGINFNVQALSFDRFKEIYKDRLGKYYKDIPPSVFRKAFAHSLVDKMQKAKTPNQIGVYVNDAKYEKAIDEFSGGPAKRALSNEAMDRLAKKAKKPQATKETAPEIKEVDKQIADAQKAVKAAETALANKAKSLDKSIVKDAEDLFGGRQSDNEGPKLFDERVDIAQRDKATEKERKAVEDAKNDLKKLKEKKKELQKTGKVTREIEFDEKDANFEALYKANQELFGLDKEQAMASAIVTDRMIGEMAAREGITKAQMYGKIEFKKSDQAPGDALLQNGSSFWKSTAQEGLALIKQTAATPEQWVKMITDRGGKGTAQELEWIGLKDYLNSIYIGKNKVDLNDQRAVVGKYIGSIPKEVVEQYVSDNKIEIEEVQKKTPKELTWVREEETGLLQSSQGNYEIRPNLGNNGQTIFELYQGNKFINRFFTEADAKEEITRGQYEISDNSTPKYSSYTLEGGENYREVLLTMPNNVPFLGEYNLKLVERQNLLTEVGMDRPTEFQNQKFDQNKKELEELKSKLPLYKLRKKTNSGDFLEVAEEYTSGHWNEANILAHVRMNERTLPNGERVMFVEEIQSDWAQEGKKSGFISKENEQIKDEIRKALKEAEAAAIESFKFERRITDQAFSKIKTMTNAGARYFAAGLTFSFTDGDIKLYAPTNKLGLEFGEVGNYKVYKDPKDDLYFISDTGKPKGGNRYSTRQMAHDQLEKQIQTRNPFSKKEFDKSLLNEKEREAHDWLKKNYYEEKESIEKPINDALEKGLIKYGDQEGEFIGKYPENMGDTPNMPYKKTDQWVGMSVRRVMQMAANEGFDRVAWVTGEQSADRYDLSKQVRKIDVEAFKTYRDVSVLHHMGSFPFTVNNDGVVTKGEYKGKPLDEVVGKEMASKIMNVEFRNTFEGQDLKVGGEGMKAFYNKILPKVAKKEAQRFDKASKVEVVEINTPTDVAFPVKVVKNNPDNNPNELSRLEGLRDEALIRNDVERADDLGARIARLTEVKDVDYFRTEQQAKDWISGQKNKEAYSVVGTEKGSKQLSIPITDKARQALRGAIPLFQATQGAMMAEDGKFVVYALSNPNVSTPLHEMAHVYEHYLTKNERKDVLKWAGHKTWGRQTSEKFARGFEAYLAKGKAPSTGLQKLFDKFKTWLTDIYNGITNSEIDIDISPKMEKIYEKMLGKEMVEEGRLQRLDNKLKNIDKSLKKFGKETLGVNIPVAIARTAVIAMRGAIRTAKTAGEVLDAGWSAIKGTKWYQRLKGSERQALNEKGLVNILNDAFAQHNAITPEEAANMTDETYKESNDALNTGPKNWKEKKKKAGRKIIKALTDRQFLSKKLVGEAGMNTVKALMINAHGSSGKAARIFKDAYNDIWRNLKTKERETLDKFIFLRRVIAIDTNREKKNLPQVMHPKGLDADTAQKALNFYKEQLGEKKFNNYIARADKYFEVYQTILDAKYENGLINKAVYESLKGLDYQPRLFLEHILDFEGNVNMGKAQAKKSDTGGLSEEQIKSLDEGSMNNLIMNSEWLLSTSIAGATKSMSMNNINRKFIEKEFPKAKKYAEKLRGKIGKPGQVISKEDQRFLNYFEELENSIIDNPIVKMVDASTVDNSETDLTLIGTEKGPIKKPVYKYSKSPKPGFSKAYWYKDGVKHEFFIEDKLHDSWFDNSNGLFQGETREIVSYASGSALLKGIATGNNPSFAIVNTPRDYLFTAVFSDQYSMVLLKAIGQVAKDAGSGIKSAFLYSRGQRENNLLQKYIEYGGDMAFLSTQGRLKSGTQLAEALNTMIGARTKDKASSIFNIATARDLSTYSEIMFRLALFKRGIKNQLKERGLKSLDEVQDLVDKDGNVIETKQEIVDDIYNLATANARSLLDFNQGGTLAKDMEAIVPYLNTAIQGTRVAYDAFAKDPAITTFRVFQAGVLGSSATILMSLLTILATRDDDDENSVIDIWMKAMSGISEYQKRMYFNVPTGRKNKEGEYNVWRFAKNHQLTPMFAITDALSFNTLAWAFDRPERIDAKKITSNSFNAFNDNISPISLYNAGSGTVADGVVSGAAQNVTRNPLMKSILTYATGYDFYRDQPLARNVNSGPKAFEGQNLSNVESFYKELGRSYGLSPVRVKGAVESFITQPSTNPFIGFAYESVDAVTNDDKTMDQLAKNLGKGFAKSFVGRISTYSNEFNRSLNTNEKFRESEKELELQEGFEKIDNKRIAKRFSMGDISFNELQEEISSMDPERQKQIIDTSMDYMQLSLVVDQNVIDIKFGGSSKMRALMILNRYGNLFNGEPENVEILRQMDVAGGILTDNVLKEYNKLISEVGDKKQDRQ